MKTDYLGSFVKFAYGKGLLDRSRKPGPVPVYGSAGVVDSHIEALAVGPGVIVGRKGTIGSVHWSDGDFWPIDTTYYVLPRNDAVRLRYIYYLLKSLPLSQMNTDAAVPGLNREHALGLKVRMPSLIRQDRIVSILSAYDDLIENNRRRIQLLEQAARLLYKEWFEQLRFPGHEHVRVKDGVPEGWERKPLSEIAATNAESYKADELPDRINYTDISAVKEGRIAAKNMMASAEAPGSSYPAVRPDDFERAMVLVPSNRVLKLFHDKIEPIYRLVHVLEKEMTSLSQARDLLLPRLLRIPFETAPLLIGEA